MTEASCINSQFLKLLVEDILKQLKLFFVLNLGSIQVTLHLCPDARLKLLILIFGNELCV
jgi:hypothetical protein